MSRVALAALSGKPSAWRSRHSGRHSGPIRETRHLARCAGGVRLLSVRVGVDPRGAVVRGSSSNQNSVHHWPWTISSCSIDARVSSSLRRSSK